MSYEDARVRNQRHRASALGVAATLTLEQWQQTLTDFDGLCAYCQEKDFDVLEHFIPIATAGTIVNNCVPACWDCNYKKSDHTGEKLVRLFGQATIDRISQYLASRSEMGEIILPEPPAPVPTKKPMRLLSVKSVAQCLDVSERKVYRMIERKELLAYRIRGVWRVPEDRIAGD